MKLKIKKWLYEKDLFEYKVIRKVVGGKYTFLQLNNVRLWSPSEFVCKHLSHYTILDMEDYEKS